MSVRRCGSLVVVWFCMLGGCASLLSASAQAKVVHLFAGSFPAGGSEPFGVAVNDTTHDVYVVDRASKHVVEFDETGTSILGEFDGSGSPTGAFSEPTEIAVDNSGNPLDPSQGDVYVVDNIHGVVDKFSAAGTYQSQLTGAPKGAFSKGANDLGVAVGPDGTVWVLQHASGRVDSFTDGLVNEYISETDSGDTSLRNGFGLDTGGDFYLNKGEKIESYTKSGLSIKPNLDSEDPAANFDTGLTVDPAQSEIYIDNVNPFFTESTIGAFSLTGTPIERFGLGHLGFSRGVAVDASDGTVYASDVTTGRVSFFNAVTVPSVSAGQLSGRSPRSVTFNGTVDPEGEPVTRCVFEYGPTASYGQSAPCSPASVGKGTSPVAVSAVVTGLTPENTYHYRLVAENSSGVASSTQDQEFIAGPFFGNVFAAEVRSSSATVQLEVNPNGADTGYYIEYGETEAYGSYAPAPPPGLDLGAGSAPQSLATHLQGLEAGQTYHYRAVVLQSGEVFDGTDRTFTTQRAGGALELPDGRRWELVSPPDKGGALIENTAIAQAAADGSGITYTASEPIGENISGHVGQNLEALSSATLLSSRAKGGWRTRDISPTGGLEPEGRPNTDLIETAEAFYLFSPDLSKATFEPRFGLAPQSSQATEPTLYLRNNVSEEYEPLVTTSNLPPGVKLDPPPNEWTATSFPEFVTATPDLDHIVFSSYSDLTEEATTSSKELHNLFEWSGGELQLINVLPNGESPPGVAFGNEVDTSTMGGQTPNALSSDGRWVVFHYGSVGGDAKYYVRDMVEKTTVPLGAPKGNTRFETMSRDGKRIFYLEQAGNGNEKVEGELYEFDTSTGVARDLTAGHLAGEPNAGVQNNLLGTSENASSIYFVARGVLANGASRGGDNLYLLHESSGEWTTTFIATLSPEDAHDWHGFDNFRELEKITSRVSPNGRYLTFMSDRSLTGYDNRDARSGQPDEEVYLYDARANRLVCVSCNPSGARPIGVLDTSTGGSRGGGSTLMDFVGSWDGGDGPMDGNEAPRWLASAIPPGWDVNWKVAYYQPRYLSNEGRLFFDSSDALVPQDTNGLTDVYEYEPSGLGNCTNASATFNERTGGCVNLISSGQSRQESAFLDASESGDDVFFLTSSRLVSEDYDTAYDVYDAHVCGEAAPCRAEPVSSPPCSSGDSCKAAPSPQPEVFGPAPSATFAGVGNVVEETKTVVKPKHKARKKRPKKKKRSQAKRGKSSGVRRSGKSRGAGEPR